MYMRWKRITLMCFISRVKTYANICYINTCLHLFRHLKTFSSVMLWICGIALSVAKWQWSKSLVNMFSTKLRMYILWNWLHFCKTYNIWSQMYYVTRWKGLYRQDLRSIFICYNISLVEYYLRIAQFSSDAFYLKASLKAYLIRRCRI